MARKKDTAPPTNDKTFRVTMRRGETFDYRGSDCTTGDGMIFLWRVIDGREQAQLVLTVHAVRSIERVLPDGQFCVSYA